MRKRRSVLKKIIKWKKKLNFTLKMRYVEWNIHNSIRRLCSVVQDQFLDHWLDIGKMEALVVLFCDHTTYIVVDVMKTVLSRVEWQFYNTIIVKSQNVVIVQNLLRIEFIFPFLPHSISQRTTSSSRFRIICRYIIYESISICISNSFTITNGKQTHWPCPVKKLVAVSCAMVSSYCWREELIRLATKRRWK